MADTDTWHFAGDPGEKAVAQVMPHGVAAALAKNQPPVLANPAPAATLFPHNVLDVARAEAAAGISVASNPARVADYLAVVDIPFNPATAFCGAGVAWSVCKAYCDLNGVPYSGPGVNPLTALKSVRPDINLRYFLTAAWVPDTVADANARKTWVTDPKLVQPGYLIFFNWRDDKDFPWPRAQHIGLVEKAPNGSQVDTIEFNTSFPSGPHKGQKGAVAQRSRDLYCVVGFVRTY